MERARGKRNKTEDLARKPRKKLKFKVARTVEAVTHATMQVLIVIFLW